MEPQARPQACHLGHSITANGHANRMVVWYNLHKNEATPRNYNVEVATSRFPEILVLNEHNADVTEQKIVDSEILRYLS
jgi:hypothetical protein